MRKDKFAIIENEKIANDIYKMVLVGNTLGYDKPGIFAEISIDLCYLNRPISMSWVEGDELTLVYKIVGKGTKLMSEIKTGNEITLLGPLGSGYNIEAGYKRPLVIGGGIGIPPLLYLTKKLIENGIKPKVILGFNDAKEVFYEKDFKNLCADVQILTLNGTYGNKGLVTDILEFEEYIYSCGPLPMLKAISNKCKHGQFSLEARMGCGFGACMGCSIETVNGPKRVCKEGPIFDKEEIIWKD